MNWLSAAPAWCWWALTLLVVAGGQQVRVSGAQVDTADARQELAGYRLEVAERDRRAAAQARAEEQRRQAAADKQDEEAREHIKTLEGKLVTADAKSVGLRGEIDRLRAGRSATCNTITAQQRQAGGAAVVVLGGLLEEADRMAGSLAEALERSRIAGLACESTYDAVRGIR